jgi:hypothetical protein
MMPIATDMRNDSFMTDQGSTREIASRTRRGPDPLLSEELAVDDVAAGFAGAAFAAAGFAPAGLVSGAVLVAVVSAGLAVPGFVAVDEPEPVFAPDFGVVAVPRELVSVAVRPPVGLAVPDCLP